MNTKESIEPLLRKRDILENEKGRLIDKINLEIEKVQTSINDTVRKLNGISDNERTWVVGDVFTTTFWGKAEVCIIRTIDEGDVKFIRLESIRYLNTIKKDFCAAGIDIQLFLKINKNFIHHSKWYCESDF